MPQSVILSWPEYEDLKRQAVKGQFSGHDLVLKLAASISLSETIGDVLEDIDTALRMVGVQIDFGSSEELQAALRARGVTTLHDTEI